jgi:osmotically-inducible protein OsmY
MEHEIRKALRENEQTAGLDIAVKFVNGAVFLDGTAPTAVAKEAAAEVARKVEGVAFVRNRLQVKPEAHTSREQFREGERRP